MSYGFRVARHPEGHLVVENEYGDVPAGTFDVNGHTTPESSNIGISHHKEGLVTVQAHGYAQHVLCFHEKEHAHGAEHTAEHASVAEVQEESVADPSSQPESGEGYSEEAPATGGFLTE